MRFSSVILAASIVLLPLIFGCGTCSGGTSETTDGGGDRRLDWSDKLPGEWGLSMESAIAAAPEGQRGLLRFLHLSFRPEPPSEQELDHPDFSDEQRRAVMGLRTLSREDPFNPEVIDARRRYEMFATALPRLEITEETFGLVTHKRRDVNPYQVTKQEGRIVRLKVSDLEQGGEDLFTIDFVDEDTIRVAEQGDQTPLTFVRNRQPTPAEPNLTKNGDRGPALSPPGDLGPAPPGDLGPSGDAGPLPGLLDPEGEVPPMLRAVDAGAGAPAADQNE